MSDTTQSPETQEVRKNGMDAFKEATGKTLEGALNAEKLFEQSVEGVALTAGQLEVIETFAKNLAAQLGISDEISQKVITALEAEYNNKRGEL